MNTFDVFDAHDSKHYINTSIRCHDLGGTPTLKVGYTVRKNRNICIKGHTKVKEVHL